MPQPVEDAVGSGWIADLGVPVRDRDLGGQYGGTGLVAVIADLQKIAAFDFSERRHAEVVDHQHVGERELAQKTAKAAIGMSQREFAEQLRGAGVIDRVAVAAGLV